LKIGPCVLNKAEFAENEPKPRLPPCEQGKIMQPKLEFILKLKHKHEQRELNPYPF
jgi:hypothetical protein